MPRSAKSAAESTKYLLESCGFICTDGMSNQSDSCYLEIYHPDVEGSDRKIRFGNHELPRHYGTPDYDIGGNNMMAGWKMDDYMFLAEEICQKFSIPMSSALRRVLSARRNRDAKKQAEIELLAESRQKKVEDRMAAALPIYLANSEVIDSAVHKINSLHGQPRRRARSAFNQKWGEYAYELRCHSANHTGEGS